VNSSDLEILAIPCSGNDSLRDRSSDLISNGMILDGGSDEKLVLNVDTVVRLSDLLDVCICECDD
jgi:hypothetical protein